MMDMVPGYYGRASAELHVQITLAVFFFLITCPKGQSKKKKNTYYKTPNIVS